MKKIEKKQRNLTSSISASEAEKLVKAGVSPWIFLQYWDPEMNKYVRITSDDVLSLYTARAELSRRYKWRKIPFLYIIINQKNVVVLSDIKNIPV